LPKAADIRIYAEIMKIRSQLWIALLLGSFLFGLSNTAVWSGMLHPPVGYEPLFLVRSHDMAEYTTYMSVASDPTWLTPNLDAPWILPGGFFDPLMLVPGRIGHWLGISPAFTFQATFYLSSIAGAWALLYAMNFFLPTARQRWWAFAAVVTALPLTLLAIVAKPLLPFPVELYGLGMVEFAYNSADGLFRGGLSNSFTIACGTIAILLALTFTAKRVVTGRVRYRYLSAATMFFSALLHPFEVFVMVPASTLALLWAAKRSGNWQEAILDCALNAGAAFMGLLPSLLLAFRYPWISDLSTIFTERMYPTWLLAIYGLPCIFVLYCLLLRYHAVSASDQVLLIWFVSTAVIVCLPYCPYPPHLLNGFAYVTAMLLIRLLFEHRQTISLYQRRPKLVLGLSSSVVALSLIAMAMLHVQLWKDGRSSQPAMLLSAVTSTDERGVAEWLRRKVSREDLVLAPPELAPWLTLVPMHAFASHVQHSFNYAQQFQEASAFYQGELPRIAQELLQGYGVHWVVAPSASPAVRYFDGPPATEIGALRIYEIPGNSLKPYPGLAQLVPSAANAKSLSRLVMDAKAYLSGKRHP
jgi:hypothetical protein